MPKFSKGSLARLETCHPELIRVAHAAIEHFDFAVITGHRGELAQNVAYKSGNSQRTWPNGEHNRIPSDAMDLMPWPVDWSGLNKNTERNCLLAGIILATGWNLGIDLRWGGDWDHDNDTRDEKFRDYAHFERRAK